MLSESRDNPKVEGAPVSGDTHDLARFSLRDMIECGRALRLAAESAGSMEGAASAIVHYLYAHLAGAEGPNCALVRCFKTHRLGQLPEELLRAARSTMVQKEPSPELPCLTLLATAGDCPEWNDRRRSRGHAAIPLESVEMVERAPMIASLIGQMGLGIEATLYPNPQLILDADQHAFNVFHVEHAVGDASIPAQKDFVLRYGVQSVLGFGGLLPSGDLFAVILFSKVPIRRRTATLFRTIALGVKLALLPHTRGRIFDDPGLGGEAAVDASLQAVQDEQLRSERATLQLLLTALEDATLDQTKQLQVAYDELKVQGEMVQSSEERLRLAQQAARMASWDWNLETDAVIWDEGSAKTYGRPAAEMASMQQILRYVDEGDAARVWGDLSHAVAGRGNYSSTYKVCWPDGSSRWIQAFGETIFSGDKPVRVVGVNLDVTETKIAEQALIRNEKLAAVGRLASSIAHEINNPLESVTNLLYLADKSRDLAEAREFLGIADIELRRVSAIANQTLRFNKQATRPTKVLGSELMAGALAIYQGRISNSRIRVERRSDSERELLCFEGEIRQVISNLIVNAIDAMPGGGRLVLRSRVGRAWRSGREGAVLTVADTGSGMSEELREKIFEAFYTTKGIGGTGLGLWISREILERHQGTLSVRSSRRAGRTGSVFSVFLPFDVLAG